MSNRAMRLDRASRWAIAWLRVRAAGGPPPECRFGGPDGPIIAPEDLDQIARAQLRDVARELENMLHALKQEDIPR